MNNTVKPNLFLIGGMKCGTTILSEFLSAHPAISAASTKETHYFSLNECRGEDWYLSHFDPKAGARYFLDASTSYFNQANSISIPQKIKNFSPEAKLILLIRDPLQRSISHFLHLRDIVKVPVLQGMTFNQLIAQDWMGAIAETDEASFHLANVLSYSAYRRRLFFFQHVFDAESLMVVHNEDLARHGKTVMTQIFNFLELDSVEGGEFDRRDYQLQRDDESLKLKDRVKFYSVFGTDYFRTCTDVDIVRPSSASSDVRFNQPVGAIVGDVAIGRDGWLFLVGGTNRFVETFTESEGASLANVDAWNSILRRRKHRLSSLGSDYLHCIVPEKLTVYGEYLDWELNWELSPGHRFNQSCGRDLEPNCLDLFPVFFNNRYSQNLYLKTDSHWTYQGAFLAYQMICAKLGIEFRAELLNRPYDEAELALDLGSKLESGPIERARFYRCRQNAELVGENEIVRIKRLLFKPDDPGLHVGSLVKFRNAQSTDARKILIFGDSFSEYRDHLLTALLAETFSETTFLWSTSIDYDVVSETKPDLVLSVMTERFMKALPDDSFNLRSYEEVIKRRYATALAGAKE